MRKTVLEVSRKAFRDNVLAVKRRVGDDVLIMPVVKANAYGTYLNRDIELMNEFNMVGVAIVDEAVYLRENGYKGDILVLNQPYVDEIEMIVSNDIVIGCSSISFLEEVCKRNLNIRIHVEVETGMGRTGILSQDFDRFLEFVSNENNISVEGVYSHLASADIDYEFTNKQISLFNEKVLKAKAMFPNIKYVHLAASNGILNFDLGLCNMVRPGIILYGYPSSKSTLDKIELEPVAKLKSKISYIKIIDIGDSISYGRSFVASEQLVVATVGCGYADGVRRELSNRGYVAVKGKRCKILGKVCMDSIIIDITDVNDACVGDDVYIFDNDVVTLDELALVCGTINYEMLSTIGERVPRKFVD